MRQAGGTAERRIAASAEGAAILPPRRLAVLGGVCGVAGVLGWVLWVAALKGDPAQDWMVFYTAARSWFDGNLPLVFDGEALTAAINRRFADWLAFPLNPHPWVYPPPFLLMLLPFGGVPPVASVLAFLLAGFGLAVVAGFAYGGRGLPGKALAFTLVLCPAAALNVMTGQNAFYSAAALLGGFALIDRAPVLAGILFGLLSVKPQLWPLLPLALLAARRWTALTSAILTAAGLALLSLVVFGPEIWQRWIALATGADEAYRAWLVAGRLNGQSVFACLSVLGLPQTAASVGQAVAVLIAAAVTWWSFRRPAPPALQFAALLAATMLAAPHASTSDAILLGLAASIYLTAPRPAPLPGAHVALAALLWVSPLFNPPRIFPAGVVTPVIILLFLTAVLAEMRRSAAVEADSA